VSAGEPNFSRPCGAVTGAGGHWRPLASTTGFQALRREAQGPRQLLASAAGIGLRLSPVGQRVVLGPAQLLQEAGVGHALLVRHPRRVRSVRHHRGLRDGGGAQLGRQAQLVQVAVAQDEVHTLRVLPVNTQRQRRGVSQRLGCPEAGISGSDGSHGAAQPTMHLLPNGKGASMPVDLLTPPFSVRLRCWRQLVPGGQGVLT
jgi:hypothetical protein